MRYHEIICEASDAPLYHATNFKAAREILDSGSIIGRYESNPFGKGERLAISFSRDPGFHFMNNPVQFILDGRKLRQRFKITPYDWYARRGSGPRRFEKEERIHAPETGIPLSFVTAIVLMPNRQPHPPSIDAAMRRIGDEIIQKAQEMSIRTLDLRDHKTAIMGRHLRD